MFIDTHAHLNFNAFKLDWEQVAQRAHAKNVKAIINIGSNYKTSKEAVEIAKKIPFLYAAVGLHPIHVKDEDFNEEKFLKLIKNKKVVAIGETGLDYYFRSAKAEENKLVYYDKSNSEIQKEVFEKSLKMAMVSSKPMILHSREASEDVLSILLGQKPEPRGVMHCFQEDWRFAKIIIEMGLYISFTGLITFTKNYKTFEVIKNMPLERILIETDCPFMTPEPYRGKRNEPSFVIEIAKKIAEIKKIPLEKVAETTTKNAKELFKLDE